MENILDKTTQLWVKWSGKRILPEKFDWLLGPIGDADKIADQFVERLAKAEGFKVERPTRDAGLLDHFEDLELSDEDMLRLNPEIIDFYTKTSNYKIEFWSSWKGIFRWFGWLLAILFSRRLKQLNLPLDPMDASRGLESQILKLKKEQKSVWTIWYRMLNATNRVIYSGVYTHCKHPESGQRLLKVVFPLPNGNAAVVMKVEVKSDGSLLLYSEGKRFGDHGFYFTLTDHKGKYWAKFVRAMHEWIHVYVDEEGVLRTDHKLNFHGMRFLELHYKLTKT